MIIDTGKVLRIVTNDLDAPAQEIADLYKQRWQIELFFRWVKQTLQDQALHWGLRECRPHSDRHRPDRLSHLAHAADGSKNGTQPPRICPARPRQSHAQTPDQRLAQTPAADPDKLKSVETWTILPMNRTPVAQGRA